MKADRNGAKRKGFLARAACGYVIHYSIAIKLCNQDLCTHLDLYERTKGKYKDFKVVTSLNF